MINSRGHHIVLTTDVSVLTLAAAFLMQRAVARDRQAEHAELLRRIGPASRFVRRTSTTPRPAAHESWCMSHGAADTRVNHTGCRLFHADAVA